MQNDTDVVRLTRWLIASTAYRAVQASLHEMGRVLARRHREVESALSGRPYADVVQVCTPPWEVVADSMRIREWRTLREEAAKGGLDPARVQAVTAAYLRRVVLHRTTPSLDEVTVALQPVVSDALDSFRLIEIREEPVPGRWASRLIRHTVTTG